MIWRNLRVAWVHLRKQPLIHFLLILGFSLGMSVGLFALLIWNNQASMDERIDQQVSLYRITSQVNGNYHFATSGIDVYDAFEHRSEVSTLFQAISLGEVTLSTGATQEEFSEEGFVLRGSFFETFNLDWEQYERVDFSEDANVIFISQKLAQKLFGKNAGFNRTIESPTLGLLTVKGIFNDKNHQYHLQPDFYVPWELRESLVRKGSLPVSNSAERIYNGAYTYVATEADPFELTQAVSSSMASLYEGHEVISECVYLPQSLEQIFSDRLSMDTPTVLSAPNIRFYFGIALLILFISSINYFNIQLAALVKRSLEFGVRKVNGANTWQIFTQIVSENILISFLALGLGLVLIWFLPLPQSDQILQGVSLDIRLVLSLVGFAVMVGVITSAVPAYLNARKTAIYTLQKKVLGKTKKFRLSDALVGVQIAITMILVFNMVLFQKQNRMIANKDYGFSVDNFVMVKLNGVTDIDALKAEIERDASVKKTSFTSSLFGSFPEECKVSLEGSDRGLYVNYYATDSLFLDAYGIQLLDGKGLATNNPNEVLVNEEFLRLVTSQGGTGIGDVVVANDSVSLTIVGVFEDFNYDNLKRPIEPLMLWSLPEEYKYLNVQLWQNTEANAYATNLAQELYQAYQKRMKTQVYSAFLAERRDYSEDQAAIQMITFFIILITCLGLIGTILVNSDYLKKSIAINKLLGAGKRNLTFRYLKGYIKLMAVVFLIALPLAFLIGRQLLSQFVYRVPINFSHFAEVVLVTSAILLLVVLLQMAFYFNTRIIDGIKND